MSNFKEFNAIMEAAKGVADLSDGKMVCIGNRNSIINLFQKDKLKWKLIGSLQGDGDIWMNKDLLEGTPISVWHSQADSGWGPFLYDLAMEITTLMGGFLVSATFANRLMDKWDKKKGVVGGDTSGDAENVYQHYYMKRPDVGKDTPNVIFGSLDDKEKNAWHDRHFYMSQLYSKKPDTLKALIAMNQQNPVLAMGSNPQISKLILSLNQLVPSAAAA